MEKKAVNQEQGNEEPAPLHLISVQDVAMGVTPPQPTQTAPGAGDNNCPEELLTSTRGRAWFLWHCGSSCQAGLCWLQWRLWTSWCIGRTSCLCTSFCLWFSFWVFFWWYWDGVAFIWCEPTLWKGLLLFRHWNKQTQNKVCCSTEGSRYSGVENTTTS